MKTTFRAKQPYADQFLACAREFVCNSPVKPIRFIEKMKKNQGSVASGFDPEDGLLRKNPVIVAMGDSVTAGHFEMLFTGSHEEFQEQMRQMEQRNQVKKESFPDLEITDARESYVEKFRYQLIDYYERTSVSVINAGIAGDNLIQMSARTERDILRYQPDLVLINGSLNWDIHLGTTAKYKELLRKMVQQIKKETEADIILLTPNGELPNTLFFGINAPEPTTPERVRAIRELTEEEQVCLADVYAVWETARERGIPWKELLANGINHPGVEGHEVYAMVLMKLF